MEGPLSPAECDYREKLDNLKVPSGDYWEERFILALIANNLMLSAEPMASYHICAPLPRSGTVITWEQCFIVEKP